MRSSASAVAAPLLQFLVLGDTPTLEAVLRITTLKSRPLYLVVDVCCVRTLETNVARDSYSDTAFSLWSKWPHYRYEIRMYIQYTMDANSTTCSCASNWQLNKYTSQERVPRHIQALYVFFGILVAHIAQLLNRNTTEIPPQISSWEPYGFRTRGFYLPQYLWGYIYIYMKPARGPQTMFLWLRVVFKCRHVCQI